MSKVTGSERDRSRREEASESGARGRYSLDAHDDDGFGAEPEDHRRRRAQMLSLRRIVSAILVFAALAIAAEARAQDPSALPSPLRVEHVLAFAREHRAEIDAARARTDAAAQRPAIVSVPDDPMIMISLDHLPFRLDGADFSAMVQQTFPLSRVLGYRREAADAEARRFAADARRVVLDVQFEAVRAFFMLDERRRSAAVLDEQILVAREVVALTNARYAAGQGSQAEVLRAQVELVRLEAERGALTALISAAEAMLNAAIGREAHLPVPAIAPVSTSAEPPPTDTIVSAALTRRPEIAAARSEQERMHAEVGMMRSMYWPMALVRAGAVHSMIEGPGVMIMLGVSVPIIWGAARRAGVDEALAMVRMSDAELRAMRVMIQGEVVAARDEVLAWRARLASITDQVIPLARETVTAVLASYRSGQTPLVGVVDALRALLSARQDEVMASVNLGLAWARLERAMGRFGSDAR